MSDLFELLALLGVGMILVFAGAIAVDRGMRARSKERKADES